MDLSPPAGHRTLPHTADLIIEAWGPDRITCLREAAQALVDTFARAGEVPVTEPVPIRIEHDGDGSILVSLLEDVIYTVEVLGAVPVRVVLDEAEDGGIAGSFDVAPIEQVEVHGPAPKGVSFSDLSFGNVDGTWRCHVTIDV